MNTPEPCRCNAKECAKCRPPRVARISDHAPDGWRHERLKRALARRRVRTEGAYWCDGSDGA